MDQPGGLQPAAPTTKDSHTAALVKDKAKLAVAAVKGDDTQVGWGPAR